MAAGAAVNVRAGLGGGTTPRSACGGVGRRRISARPEGLRHA